MVASSPSSPVHVSLLARCKNESGCLQKRNDKLPEKFKSWFVVQHAIKLCKRDFGFEQLFHLLRSSMLEVPVTSTRLDSINCFSEKVHKLRQFRQLTGHVVHSNGGDRQLLVDNLLGPSCLLCTHPSERFL